nr:hypothetical protein Itr_chr02CG24370 [Ipomoea trifida]
MEDMISRMVSPDMHATTGNIRVRPNIRTRLVRIEPTISDPVAANSIDLLIRVRDPNKRLVDSTSIHTAPTVPDRTLPGSPLT